MKNPCELCKLAPEEKNKIVDGVIHNCHSDCVDYISWKDGLDIDRRGRLEYLAGFTFTAGQKKFARRKALEKKRGHSN